MSTTNHVRLSNLAPTAGLQGWPTWMISLVRALKKAGWKFKASGDGATKVSNGNPALDQVAGAGTTTNAGAAAASIAAPTRGRATVTGLTGIVAADKGRFLLISGAATSANNNQHQIEEVLSSTSVRIDARQFAVASDASNGALTWSILDPTASAAVTSSAVLWWCGQGPSILRIPFTVAATGTFIRGENITQASTGAEGELLGYTFSAGVGYLNVAPRLRGTGAGVHGWNTGNVVSGANSGATLTQNGTALEYVYEVVFAKPTASTEALQLFLGQFETAADSAEMFSFCATQAGCTATVHPGGGGTGNAFGAHAWVVWGTGSAPGAGVVILANIPSRGHVICVDAIPEQNYSADGSWSLVYSFTAGGNPDGFNVLGFHRLNDIEDGDLSPYATINPGGTTTLYSNTNRTNAGTASLTSQSSGGVSLFVPGSTARAPISGWLRRGLSQETFANLEAATLLLLQTNIAPQANSLFMPRVLSSPEANFSDRPRVRENIWVVNPNFFTKCYKGTFKWLYIFGGEQATDILGTVDPAWVQTAGGGNLGVVIGPAEIVAWTLT